MNDNLSKFLNQDWSERLQMRYACSRLLAGMFMLDTSSGKTIVVNCVEVYGRRRTVVSHRKSFRTRRGTSASSLPPEMTKYPHLWPTSIRDVDGTKLIVGSKAFNALITCSLRLDKPSNPETGPTTSSFCLETSVKSLSPQLSVKESAWHAASALAINENTKAISLYDGLFQITTARARFHHRSTYIRRRSFNEPTDASTTRPHTNFTLADWDNSGDDTEYRLGSQLIQSVALAVIRSEETRPPHQQCNILVRACHIRQQQIFPALIKELIVHYDIICVYHLKRKKKKEKNWAIKLLFHIHDAKGWYYENSLGQQATRFVSDERIHISSNLKFSSRHWVHLSSIITINNNSVTFICVP